MRPLVHYVWLQPTFALFRRVRSECSCGWAGKPRARTRTAERDGDKHHAAALHPAGVA